MGNPDAACRVPQPPQRTVRSHPHANVLWDKASVGCLILKINQPHRKRMGYAADNLKRGPQCLLVSLQCSRFSS